MFNKGKTIYHVEPTIQETGELVDNGLNEIYVNTAVDDGTEIAELMKCFLQKEIDNPKFKKFQKRVKYFKEDKEGVLKMCEAFDKYASNYALKKLVNAADNLINNHGFSIEEACETVNITIEDYKAVKEKEAVLV